MLKGKVMVLIFVLLLFGFTGCTPLNVAPSISSEILIDSKQDYQILLGETLEVTIANPTAECISFEPSYGIKMFAYLGSEKVSIENSIEYISEQKEIHLEKYGSAYDSLPIWIKPNLKGLEISYPLQIMTSIHGQLCNNAAATIEKDFTFKVFSTFQ